MSYEPHENLVTPARAYPQVWRLALGIVLAGITYVVGVAIYGVLLGLIVGPNWVLNAAENGFATRPQTYFVLTTFVFMAAGGVVAALMHDRELRSLLGGYMRFITDFTRSIVGVGIVVAVIIVWIALTIDVIPHTTFGIWIILLPASIILLFIQVSAEEIVFRGYLQSQLAALNLHPVVWIILPSVLFGMLHYDPETMGDAALWVALWAVGFGVLAADLTARTGTLGPAVAMHFANNFVALLVFGFSDYLGGLALYHFPFSVHDADVIIANLPIDAATMVILYLAIRLRLKV